MRISLIIISFSIFVSNLLFGQSNFYKWNEDTSSIAYFSKNLSNGDILILSDNFYTHPDANSILIDGPINYGTGLTRIDEDGNIIWQKNYPTTCFPNNCVIDNISGFIPSKYFLLDKDTNIILPFNSFAGWLPCAEDTSSNPPLYPTYIPSVYSINKNNGQISNLERLNYDSLCGNNFLLLYDTINLNQYQSIKYNQNSDYCFLEIFDTANTRISLDTIHHNFYKGTFVTKPFSQHLKIYQDSILLSENLDYIFLYNRESGTKIDSIFKEYLGLVNNVIGNNILSINVVYNSSSNSFNSSINNFEFNSNQWYSYDLLSYRIRDAIVYLDSIIFIAESSNGCFVFLSDLNFNNVVFKKITSNPNILIHNIEINKIDSTFIIVGSKDTISQNIRYPSEFFVYKEKINSINNIFTDITYPNNSKTISVYPNPTTDFLYFDYSSSVKNPTIKIFDFDGRLITEQQINNKKIDIPHLSIGLYFYKIEENEIELKTGKLIKR